MEVLDTWATLPNIKNPYDFKWAHDTDSKHRKVTETEEKEWIY